MRLSLSPESNKIHVRFPFNATYMSRIRLIPGARWKKAADAWEVPKDTRTLQQMRAMFPWATIENSVKEWEAEFEWQQKENLERKREFGRLDHDWSVLDYKLTPYQHQFKAMDLMYTNKNYALAAEMGVGKSAAAIHLLRRLKKEGSMDGKPALIVCPLSVVGVWGQEIDKHAVGELTYVKLVGNKHERLNQLSKRDKDVFIVNYEGMRILGDELKGIRFSVMICDESQKIKNRTSQQSKACFKVGQYAERRYILSGTLIVNNPLDLFGQFKFLSEEMLGSNYYGFANRYAHFVTNGRARFPVKFINLEELAERIDPWTFRVTKKECLDLPDKIYETRYVSLPPKASKIYKSLANELMAELDSGHIVTAQIVLTKLLRFSQITAGFVTTEGGEIEEIENETKINELESIIQQTEGSIVCWVKFRREMEIVARRLDRLGVSYACLNGSTPQKEREEIIRRFDDGEIRVFVGQIEAGGLGITLTAASTCVYMSNSYSLGSRLQSEDRLHRISQKNNVTYIDIICYDTIDEKIIELIKNKQNMADVINNGIGVKSFIGGILGNGKVESDTRV